MLQSYTVDQSGRRFYKWVKLGGNFTIDQSGGILQPIQSFISTFSNKKKQIIGYLQEFFSFFKDCRLQISSRN